MKRKKALSVILALLLCTTLIHGCNPGGESNGSGSEASGKEQHTDVESTGSQESDSGKVYTANIYIFGDGSQRMLEYLKNEFPERVKEAVNVIPNVQYLPWSEYGGGRSDMMYSAGEKFATNTDTTYMQRCVSKGYYADVTESVEKYGDNMRKYLDESSFIAFQVNGTQYAIPFGNKPNAGDGDVFVVRQDLLEDVGMEEITSLEDLEKFYELATEKDPSLIGYGRGINVAPFYSILDSDINILRPNPFVMMDGNKLDDDTIYNFYKSDEYRQITDITSRWVDLGIIPSYALSNREQLISEFDNGRGLFAPGSSYRHFEYMNIVRKVVPDAIMKNYYLGDKEKKPLMSRGTYSTAFAVGAKVEGEELDAYVKVFDILQSSSDWNDFMLYGVKGKDYVLKEDGSVEKLTPDGFFDSYLPDNIHFNRYPDYVTDEMIETFKHWNDGSIEMKTNGFAFDMTPVSAEYAQMQAVQQEYLDPITYGFTDYESNIDEALERLEDAGLQKFLDEYQAQFTKFMDSKNSK